MYIILSVTNSSPIITKDANEWQYFEAFLKLKHKALDGKLHLQKHKPNLYPYALALYLTVLNT